MGVNEFITRRVRVINAEIKTIASIFNSRHALRPPSTGRFPVHIQKRMQLLCTSEAMHKTPAYAIDSNSK
jgi:hypothetical protein